MRLKSFFLAIVTLAITGNVILNWLALPRNRKKLLHRLVDNYIEEKIGKQQEYSSNVLLKSYHRSVLNNEGLYEARRNVSFKEIRIAVAACGRIPEALMMIKSAIVFSRSPLRFIIFTEDSYIPQLTAALNPWRNLTNDAFSYELHKVRYPENEDEDEWLLLVTRCASQRLFFPLFLTHIDSLLFVDTDVLFMTPLEEIWREFSLMNGTQEVGAARESEPIRRNRVPGKHNHPYFNARGINAGVLLMNLTRMRSSGWTRVIIDYYHEYKPYLSSGDQDLVDIYMHFHPDRVKELNARYNFRPVFCVREHGGLEEVEERGVAILHGTGSKFYLEKPVFIAIFQSWSKYSLGTEPYTNLYQVMRHALNEADFSDCREVRHIFTKGFALLNTPWV